MFTGTSRSAAPEPAGPVSARSEAGAAAAAVIEALLDALSCGFGQVIIEVKKPEARLRDFDVKYGRIRHFRVPATDLEAEFLRFGAQAPAAPAPTKEEPPVATDPRHYLNSAEVAQRYRTTVEAVLLRFRRGQLPRPFRAGRQYLWLEADLDRWDDEHRPG